MTKPLPEWKRKNPRRPLTGEETEKRKAAGLEYSAEPAESNDPGQTIDNLINAVDVNIEERQEQKDEGPLKGLLTRAAQNLTGSTPAKRGRPKKSKVTKANKEEVSTLVITLFTLGVSAWTAPQDVKPNDAEISAFSVPLTNILLRHVNLTGKLTQDALDIISMIAAGSAYYARTASAWTVYNQERELNKIASEYGSKPIQVNESFNSPPASNDDPFNKVTHNPQQEVNSDGN